MTFTMNYSKIPIAISDLPNNGSVSPSSRSTFSGIEDSLQEWEVRMSENIGSLQLEALHFDIRHHILLAIDQISDLAALIHASPTFFQQYRLNRTFWLSHCLQLELGPVAVDAFTVNLCNSSKFRMERDEKQILQLIAEYRVRSTATELTTAFPQDTAILSIVSFYSAVIKPLASHYVRWTQSNHKDLSVPEYLGIAEKRRITRGLYRFQLFCNLFGSDGETGHFFSKDEVRLGKFLNILEPWEIEEIMCIYWFAKVAYRYVLEAVEWDFDEDNPRFDAVRTGSCMPEGAHHLRIFCDNYSNALNSLGLTVLASMFSADNHASLVKVVSEHIIWGDPQWIEMTTDEVNQKQRRETSFSERDRAQERRDEMIFQGDSENLPPLAWVCIWRGRYSNLYGSYIPDSFRDCGYIMWDAGRLIDSGVIDTLKDDECKKGYIGWSGDFEDPRDSI